MLLTHFRKATFTSAGAMAMVMSATGCGGEDPAYNSSNRGSGSLTSTTTVENAYIVPAYVPGRCAIQLNAGAEMRFTITNNRPAESERLLGVSTNAAQGARIMTTVDIPPKSTVSFGQPSSLPLDDGPPNSAVRLDHLDPELRPATSADVTFHFQEAGDMTLPVPVEACPVQIQ